MENSFEKLDRDSSRLSQKTGSEDGIFFGQCFSRVECMTAQVGKDVVVVVVVDDDDDDHHPHRQTPVRLNHHHHA